MYTPPPAWALFEQEPTTDGRILRQAFRKLFKPLGQGEVNWKETFAAGRESGVAWYIYEQDGGAGSPFDYAQASYEFLKKNAP